MRPHLKPPVCALSARLTLLTLCIAALVSGCSGLETTQASAPVVPEKPLETVAVTRGSISQVVTTTITAKARPEFAVTAPVAGKVYYVKQLAVGTAVKADQIIGWQGETLVKAPAAGVVSKISVPASTYVQAGIPVVQIAYEGFGVVGAVPTTSAYRLAKHPESAKVQFTEGPGLTSCNPVTAPPSSEITVTKETLELNETKMNVVCLLAESEGLVDGLPGKIGISGAQVDDVLTLPITAITGLDGVGQVALAQDGAEQSILDVQLGISDGTFIEITGGLNEGDEVLRYGPVLTPHPKG